MPAACDWHASSKWQDIRLLRDSFRRGSEKATVAACSPALIHGAFFNRRAERSSTSAGGVGNGYFAFKAGDAGSNPALSASSGRLVAKDALFRTVCSPAHKPSVNSD